MDSIFTAASVPEETGLSLFVQSAKLEFQASLQLLAERAVFLTAAASATIALKEEGTFLYCAVAGESPQSPGNDADVSNTSIRKCIEERVPVRTSPEENPATFELTVPVVHSDTVAGFLGLASQYEFSDDDIAVVERIAEFVSVAIEEREAAEQAPNRIAERFIVKAGMQPSSWHAPEFEVMELSPPEDSEVQRPLVDGDVHACKSCGFPISPGRALCVDCERKPDANPPAPGDLFALETHESWLSAHGYTILTVLVPILAAAIIFWLRR